MRLFLAALCCFLSAAASAGEVVVLGLFKDKAVLTIDGTRRVLKAGERSPEGVRLVSADSESAVLEIDGRTSAYSLGSHIGASFRGPSMREVQLWPDSAGMYRTAGSINGQSVDFLVDTGATVVALSSSEARRLGIDFRLRGDEGRAETAGGVVRTWRVRLDTVRVGEIVLRNVDAAVLEGEHPSRVLLGMSFLGRLEMARQNGSLSLRQVE